MCDAQVYTRQKHKHNNTCKGTYHPSTFIQHHCTQGHSHKVVHMYKPAHPAVRAQKITLAPKAKKRLPEEASLLQDINKILKAGFNFKNSGEGETV